MKPTGEIVLLFHFEESQIKKIKKALLPLGIRVKIVLEEDYRMPVGKLAGIRGEYEEASEENTENTLKELTAEMMVMHKFSSARMDLLLQTLRRAGIPRIDRKAVITSTNMHWNTYRLYEEIEREHRQMHLSQ